MFGEHYDRMQRWCLSNEYINLTINTFGDSLRNVNDPTKIKWYIESIPQKCINLIIKKKLISSERINKYNNIV